MNVNEPDKIPITTLCDKLHLKWHGNAFTIEKTKVTISTLLFANKQKSSFFLKVDNSYIWGKQTKYVQQFTFLQDYGLLGGKLLVAIPQIVADLSITNDKEETFTSKSFGEINNYEGMNYKIIECQISKALRNWINGQDTSERIKLEKQKSMFKANLTLEATSNEGVNKLNYPFTTLKYRIFILDIIGNGKLYIFYISYSSFLISLSYIILVYFIGKIVEEEGPKPDRDPFNRVEPEIEASGQLTNKKIINKYFESDSE